MPPEEFVWKLGSVVFIEEHEDPCGYNYEANMQKIAFWKEAGMTVDFFSQTPLATSVPWLAESPENLKVYLGLAEKVERIHRAALTGILSETTLEDD